MAQCHAADNVTCEIWQGEMHFLILVGVAVHAGVLVFSSEITGFLGKILVTASAFISGDLPVQVSQLLYNIQ